MSLVVDAWVGEGAGVTVTQSRSAVEAGGQGCRGVGDGSSGDGSRNGRSDGSWGGQESWFSFWSWCGGSEGQHYGEDDKLAEHVV